ncbi:hypothetical protein CesoFtcFv8_000611 [Champsocephalus esox]|uniref:Uncharacterized protein n=1 Tax=Champsocephalus esox TaxID=159716 RepID=A0AAN8HGM6_9TELE|nr:hypothetical protein CesoFtcFv8_000611 [Champsocephalus esox]
MAPREALPTSSLPLSKSEARSSCQSAQLQAPESRLSVRHSLHDSCGNNDHLLICKPVTIEIQHVCDKE